MYLTQSEAQERYDSRLPIPIWGISETGEDELLDVWNDSTTELQEQALKQATDDINSLIYTGYKTNPEQENEFPRNGSTEVPEEVKKATLELALSHLFTLVVHNNSEAWQMRAKYHNASRVEILIADARDSLSMREQTPITANSLPLLKRWIKGRVRSVDYAAR